MPAFIVCAALKLSLSQLVKARPPAPIGCSNFQHFAARISFPFPFHRHRIYGWMASNVKWKYILVAEYNTFWWIHYSIWGCLTYAPASHQTSCESDGGIQYSFLNWKQYNRSRDNAIRWTQSIRFIYVLCSHQDSLSRSFIRVLGFV